MKGDCWGSPERGLSHSGRTSWKSWHLNQALEIEWNLDMDMDMKVEEKTEPASVFVSF